MPPLLFGRFLLFFSALLSCVWGCGPTNQDSVQNAVEVRGKLTKNGQPLEVAGREIGTGMVSLTFIPVETITTGEQTFGTNVDEAGIFSLPGGMPAGDYRVVVRQWEPYPQTDKLEGKYDEQNSPLKVHINGQTAVNIELE